MYLLLPFKAGSTVKDRFLLNIAPKLNKSIVIK